MRAATYEDLLKVPDHLVAEILEGELYGAIPLVHQRPVGAPETRQSHGV